MRCSTHLISSFTVVTLRHWMLEAPLHQSQPGSVGARHSLSEALRLLPQKLSETATPERISPSGLARAAIPRRLTTLQITINAGHETRYARHDSTVTFHLKNLQELKSCCGGGGGRKRWQLNSLAHAMAFSRLASLTYPCVLPFASQRRSLGLSSLSAKFSAPIVRNAHHQKLHLLPPGSGIGKAHIFVPVSMRRCVPVERGAKGPPRRVPLLSIPSNAIIFTCNFTRTAKALQFRHQNRTRSRTRCRNLLWVMIIPHSLELGVTRQRSRASLLEAKSSSATLSWHDLHFSPSVFPSAVPFSEEILNLWLCRFLHLELLDGWSPASPDSREALM